MNPPVWQSLSELHLRPQFGGGPGGASPTSLTYAGAFKSDSFFRTPRVESERE